MTTVINTPPPVLAERDLTLDDDQLQRLDALREANALGDRLVEDLLSMAEYVINGRHLWKEVWTDGAR